MSTRATKRNDKRLHGPRRFLRDVFLILLVLVLLVSAGIFAVANVVYPGIVGNDNPVGNPFASVRHLLLIDGKEQAASSAILATVDLKGNRVYYSEVSADDQRLSDALLRKPVEGIDAYIQFDFETDSAEKFLNALKEQASTDKVFETYNPVTWVKNTYQALRGTDDNAPALKTNMNRLQMNLWLFEICEAGAYYQNGEGVSLQSEADVNAAIGSVSNFYPLSWILICPLALILLILLTALIGHKKKTKVSSKDKEDKKSGAGYKTVKKKMGGFRRFIHVVLILLLVLSVLAGVGLFGVANYMYKAPETEPVEFYPLSSIITVTDQNGEKFDVDFEKFVTTYQAYNGDQVVRFALPAYNDDFAGWLKDGTIDTNLSRVGMNLALLDVVAGVLLSEMTGWGTISWLPIYLVVLLLLILLVALVGHRKKVRVPLKRTSKKGKKGKKDSDAVQTTKKPMGGFRRFIHVVLIVLLVVSVLAGVGLFGVANYMYKAPETEPVTFYPVSSLITVTDQNGEKFDVDMEKALTTYQTYHGDQAIYFALPSYNDDFAGWLKDGTIDTNLSRVGMNLALLDVFAGVMISKTTGWGALSWLIIYPLILLALIILVALVGHRKKIQSSAKKIVTGKTQKPMGSFQCFVYVVMINLLVITILNGAGIIAVANVLYEPEDPIEIDPFHYSVTFTSDDEAYSFGCRKVLASYFDWKIGGADAYVNYEGGKLKTNLTRFGLSISAFDLCAAKVLGHQSRMLKALYVYPAIVLVLIVLVILAGHRKKIPVYDEDDEDEEEEQGKVKKTKDKHKDEYEDEEEQVKDRTVIGYDRKPVGVFRRVIHVILILLLSASLVLGIGAITAANILYEPENTVEIDPFYYSVAFTAEDEAFSFGCRRVLASYFDWEIGGADAYIHYEDGKLKTNLTRMGMSLSVLDLCMAKVLGHQSRVVKALYLYPVLILVLIALVVLVGHRKKIPVYDEDDDEEEEEEGYASETGLLTEAAFSAKMKKLEEAVHRAEAEAREARMAVNRLAGIQSGEAEESSVSEQSTQDAVEDTEDAEVEETEEKSKKNRSEKHHEVEDAKQRKAKEKAIAEQERVAKAKEKKLARAKKRRDAYRNAELTARQKAVVEMHKKNGVVEGEETPAIADAQNNAPLEQQSAVAKAPAANTANAIAPVEPGVPVAQKTEKAAKKNAEKAAEKSANKATTDANDSAYAADIQRLTEMTASLDEQVRAARAAAETACQAVQALQGQKQTVADTAAAAAVGAAAGSVATQALAPKQTREEKRKQEESKEAERRRQLAQAIEEKRELQNKRREAQKVLDKLLKEEAKQNAILDAEEAKVAAEVAEAQRYADELAAQAERRRNG